ncbi:hypothetical protein WMY93_019567 [Mugilogobius chulae]|uniref:ZP domain-containing protein n=1 Tax=Mugilogobius chulae TaxID=88201 RepID=A0AAW0NRS9_9GOBI
MLVLVLCLPALFLWPSVVIDAVNPTVDISSCPITYYGIQHTMLQLHIDGGTTFIHFGEIVGGDLVHYVQIPLINPGTVDVELNVNVSAFDQSIQTQFPHITSASTCGIHLSFLFSGESVKSNFYFMNFGNKSAVHMIIAVSPSVLALPYNFIINNAEVVETVYVSSSTTQDVDLTGCSNNVTAVAVGGKSVVDPDHCISKTCFNDGHLKVPASTCGLSETCLGNNVCGTQSFCAVVGPSIMDMAGGAGKIPNFCNYTLLQVSGFEVLGTFISHRHTDVPFLHEVTLIIPPTPHLFVLQPGNVKADSAIVDLSTPVTQFGVALSKDQTGVKAVFTDSDGVIITVFFDGTQVFVDLKVPTSATPTLSGVCANSSNIISNVATDTGNCPTVVPDTKGDDINCSSVIQSCVNKLTSLANAINCSVDITPFVNACATNLLCEYPDEDGLSCSILDAYAKVCQTQINWRETMFCPLSPCVDHVCGLNEFCAINTGGEAACFCQETFAVPYRVSTGNPFGSPATCNADTASVALYTCFLEEMGMSPNKLHLLDYNCNGTYDEQTKNMTFDFSGSNLCGGTVTDNSSVISYNNTILSTPDGVITHENTLSIAFSCIYNQPTAPSTATFTIADGSFLNEALTVPVVSALDLGQKVWVKLEAQGVGGSSVALLIQDCWATEGTDPNQTPDTT